MNLRSHSLDKLRQIITTGALARALFVCQGGVIMTWFHALATSHKGKSRVNAPVVTDPATCTVVGVGLFQ